MICFCDIPDPSWTVLFFHIVVQGFGLGESDRLEMGGPNLPFFGVGECERSLLTTGKSPNQKCNKEFGPRQVFGGLFCIQYDMFLFKCVFVYVYTHIYHVTVCRKTYIKIKTMFSFFFNCIWEYS